jgi:hypothetical protein
VCVCVCMFVCLCVCVCVFVFVYAAKRILTIPYSGSVIASHFRDMGRNALVVYDDLSAHATVYSSLKKYPLTLLDCPSFVIL